MVKYFIERAIDNKWLEHAVNKNQGSWTLVMFFIQTKNKEEKKKRDMALKIDKIWKIFKSFLPL